MLGSSLGQEPASKTGWDRKRMGTTGHKSSEIFMSFREWWPAFNWIGKSRLLEQKATQTQRETEQH